MNIRGWPVILVFCCMVSVWLGEYQSWAQTTKKETSFVLQRFRPSFDPDGVYNLYGGESLGQWRYSGGFFANFGYKPLIIVGGKRGVVEIVNWQLAGDLGFGLGLLDMKWLGLDFYAQLPMSFYMAAELPNDINCGTTGNPECSPTGLNLPAIGDLSLALKWRILGEKWHPFGLAILFNLQLPTGTVQSFHSEEQVSFHAIIAASKRFGIFRIGANLGARLRPVREFHGLQTASELTYMAGAAIMAIKDRLEFMVEFGGGVALSSLSNVRNAPLEFLGGLKFFPLSQPTLAVHLGGGAGILPGYGVPTFRAFLGFVYTSPREGAGDRDGDGLIDSEDKCPDTPGPRSHQGCPIDSDQDGIVDKRDRCPKKPGPRENQGCPWGDRDQDGVNDGEDKCPDTRGAVENKGCPWGDRDGDGLKDNLDQCPDQKGPRENHGCPDKDRDRDTLVDRKDKCPDLPGPIANKGCPLKILVTKTKSRILILKKVYFATGSARIKARSFPVLNQVVDVMKSNPKIALRIEGHTDSRGPASYNEKLSQRRVDSVRRYLINKGILAKRLVAKGFGEMKPIASNKTVAGRAKNRRVEFHILK